MMRSRTRRAQAITVTALLIFITGVAAAAEDVVLRLKWLHGAQFAGYYVADQMGFYADEGLSISYVEGATDYKEFAAVADGEFDFMVADALRVLQAPELGIPVVAVAAIYQYDPLVFFSLAEKGIETPYDLIGKTVMSYGVMLPALMGKLAIPMEELNVVGLSYDLSLLYTGEVDVWIGYLINEAVRVRLDGHAINIIHPSDYGVDIYGDALITAQRLVDENPDLVHRFVRATIRGWEYAAEHIEEAAGFALLYDPDLDLEHQIGVLDASLRLLHAGRARIGWMEHDRWQFVADTLYTYGQVEFEINVEVSYDMQFIEAIYEERE